MANLESTLNGAPGGPKMEREHFRQLRAFTEQKKAELLPPPKKAKS